MVYIKLPAIYLSNHHCVHYAIVFTRSSYRGKILWFDVDNPEEGRGYAVPPDNPYIDDPSALPEIYASGIRMPWRCSADLGDPETGDGAGRVFCPDVGSKIAEEVNIVEKGGDYGYPTFEGYVC